MSGHATSRAHEGLLSGHRVAAAGCGRAGGGAAAGGCLVCGGGAACAGTDPASCGTATGWAATGVLCMPGPARGGGALTGGVDLQAQRIVIRVLIQHEGCSCSRSPCAPEDGESARSWTTPGSEGSGAYGAVSALRLLSLLLVLRSGTICFNLPIKPFFLGSSAPLSRLAEDVVDTSRGSCACAGGSCVGGRGCAATGKAAAARGGGLLSAACGRHGADEGRAEPPPPGTSPSRWYCCCAQPRGGGACSRGRGRCCPEGCSEDCAGGCRPPACPPPSPPFSPASTPGRSLPLPPPAALGTDVGSCCTPPGPLPPPASPTRPRGGAETSAAAGGPRAIPSGA